MIPSLCSFLLVIETLDFYCQNTVCCASYYRGVYSTIMWDKNMRKYMQAPSEGSEDVIISWIE